MTRRADVVIREDHPTRLEAISTGARGCGLDILATRSPRQAMRLLREHDPVLAILDWNTRVSPAVEQSAATVLRGLAGDHPKTVTFVLAPGVGADTDLPERIAVAHPAGSHTASARGWPGCCCACASSSGVE